MRELIDFNTTTPDFGKPNITYDKGVLVIGNKNGQRGSKLHPDEPGILFFELKKAIKNNLDFNDSLYIKFYLSFINTTSMKYLRDLLIELNEYEGKEIKVFWYHDEYDESIESLGEDLEYVVECINKKNAVNKRPDFKFQLIKFSYEK